MTDIEKAEAIKKAAADLLKAEAASKKACLARGRLPHGSTRARVTTANANWARSAEARDRLMDHLRKLCAEFVPSSAP